MMPKDPKKYAEKIIGDITQIKKKLLNKKIFSSLNFKIIGTIIGIIATLLLQNLTTYYVEKISPKVHFEIGVTSIDLFPKVHLLSDAKNTFISATLDYQLPFFLTLENDNHRPIYIEDISLVVDSYEKIPRDSFLLIKDYFSQGENPVIALGTSKKINSYDKYYSFSLIDSDTGEMTDGKYLLIDEGYTDVYTPNFEFEDEGLYTFHFEVSYRIHGKTHIEKTDKMRIMNITGKEYELENPQDTELRNHIVFSNPDSDYTIYGDGTIVLGKPQDTVFVYSDFSLLLKKVEIEDGVKEINKNHINAMGDNVKEIYLPSSITTIDDGAFEGPLLTESYEKNGYCTYSPKTIIYDGTYDDWNNKVKIGKYNHALYQYDYVFTDGYKGYIYSHIPGGLGELARDYFINKYGDEFRPVEYDVFSNNNGTYTIYLYRILYPEEDVITLTSYTVDENGIGVEDVSGESIILK